MPASAPSGAERDLELAHVLFVDVVGYSKTLVDEQREILRELNAIVRQTEQFRKAAGQEKLVCLPTGDGMALAFFTTPEAPVRCAVEIARALKNHPEIQLRMGVHTGPVNTVADVNERTNVAGAGINTAQRVMDCGDAGHILLSQRVAEDLGQSREWSPLLHDLGECEVKHGVWIHLFNFHGRDFGNASTPTRVKRGTQSRKKRSWVMPIAVGAVVLLVLTVVSYQLFRSKRRESPATVAPEKSIAVLPFENLSEDKSNAYFTEGMQDEILTRLANLRELKVISRTSTSKYRSHPDNLKTIAAELGVANILEGSVQKRANDVHVNVQLIKADTDEHIWAQSFDRTMEHAFAVEGEVAQTVSDALKLALAPSQVAKLNKPVTEKPAAYDLFLKGEYELNRAWAEATEFSETALKAAEYYRQAVKVDPEFSLAYAALARADLSEYHFHADYEAAERKPELADEAKRNIDTALVLTPDLATAHLAFGEWHYWTRHDYPNAIIELRRALSLDPHLTDAIIRIAAIMLRQGEPEKALNELQPALEFDPRNVVVHRSAGFAYEMMREYDRAGDAFTRAISLDLKDSSDIANLAENLEARGNLEAAARTLESYPKEERSSPIFAIERLRLLQLARDYHGMEEVLKSLPPGNFVNAWSRSVKMGEAARGLGQAELAQQSFKEARTALQAALARDPHEPNTQGELAWVDAQLGNGGEAVKEAKRAIELAEEEHDFRTVGECRATLAAVYAQLGRAHDALKVLAELFAAPTGMSISRVQLKLASDWDPIRDDPRFQKLYQDSPSPTSK
jgi:TolB-like protein/Tfp pilus assembly protein PilF/class 3 adenylate cyclase